MYINLYRGNYGMKIIFLDIDGVLNSNFWNNNHQKEISDGTLIDEEKVELLSKLTREMDAKVILHSGWKYWFDNDMNPLRREAKKLKNLLEKYGIEIEGMTPDLATEEIRRTKKFSLVKADEILLWLSEHTQVDKWIVIDDLDLHNEEIEKRQIRTDSSVGLTVQNVEEAEILLM